MMSVKKKKLVSSGFTVVELLMALVIAGLLLAALTVALNASIVNYRENDEMYQAINKARQALTRMTSELRTATAVEPTDPENLCRFYNAAGDNITYEYRAAEYKLYLNEYTLCDNVTAATFTKTPTADGTECKSVQIILTVQSGNHQQKLAAAAVVRRVLDH